MASQMANGGHCENSASSIILLKQSQKNHNILGGQVQKMKRTLSQSPKLGGHYYRAPNHADPIFKLGGQWQYRPWSIIRVSWCSIGLIIGCN